MGVDMSNEDLKPKAFASSPCCLQELEIQAPTQTDLLVLLNGLVEMRDVHLANIERSNALAT